MSCSRVKCAYDLSDTTRGCQLYPKAETLGPISIPGVTAKGTFHTNKSYLCSNIFMVFTKKVFHLCILIMRLFHK